MGKSHRDQRRHRRKVAGTARGLREHQKRDIRRGRNKPGPGGVDIDVPRKDRGEGEDRNA